MLQIGQDWLLEPIRCRGLQPHIPGPFLLLSVPCLTAAVTIPEPRMKNSMSLTWHRSKTNSQIKDFAFPLHSQTVKKAYAWKAENASPLLGPVLYSRKKISLHERKLNSRKLKEICNWWDGREQGEALWTMVKRAFNYQPPGQKKSLPTLKPILVT